MVAASFCVCMKTLTKKVLNSSPFLTQLAQEHLPSIFDFIVLMEQRDVLVQFLQAVAPVN